MNKVLLLDTEGIKMISRTTYEHPEIIHVFSIMYYHNKDHLIQSHIFGNFEDACKVVAEVWAFEPNNVYTIVDDNG